MWAENLAIGVQMFNYHDIHLVYNRHLLQLPPVREEQPPPPAPPPPPPPPPQIAYHEEEDDDDYDDDDDYEEPQVRVVERIVYVEPPQSQLQARAEMAAGYAAGWLIWDWLQGKYVERVPPGVDPNQHSSDKSREKQERDWRLGWRGR